MAVAPPFANLLGGMTKLRIRNPKSHPVHRGQVDFENSGTTILKTMLLPLRSRLAPPGVGATLKVLRPIVPERSMLTEICIGVKQSHRCQCHNRHVTPAPDNPKFP